MSDVARWLSELGLTEYDKVFADNLIDVEVLSDLTGDDLKDIGVPLGHRKKLLRAIEALKVSSSEPVSGDRDAPPPAGAATDAVILSAETQDAERRQLTVMFVDMVGSTQLSTLTLGYSESQNSVRVLRPKISKFDEPDFRV